MRSGARLIRDKNRHQPGRGESGDSWNLASEASRSRGTSVLPNQKGGPPSRSALNVIELSDMTPDMTIWGVGMGPELNMEYRGPDWQR